MRAVVDANAEAIDQLTTQPAGGRSEEQRHDLEAEHTARERVGRLLRAARGSHARALRLAASLARCRRVSCAYRDLDFRASRSARERRESRAMARVFVTRRLPGTALERLTAEHEVEVWPGDMPPSPEELRARVADVEGLLSLLTERIDSELLAAAPRLRATANYAIGFDNVEVEAVTARGIPVEVTPDAVRLKPVDVVLADHHYWGGMHGCQELGRVCRSDPELRRQAGRDGKELQATMPGGARVLDRPLDDAM